MMEAVLQLASALRQAGKAREADELLRTYSSQAWRTAFLDIPYLDPYLTLDGVDRCSPRAVSDNTTI